MQTKKHSLIEAILNTIIGWSIGIITQIIIFPFFDIQVSLKQNFYISIIFMIVSIIRSYVLRRFFNKITHKLTQRITHES